MTSTTALLRLQEIDLELSRIESRAKDLPEHERLKAVEAARKKLAAQLTQLLGKRKDLEMDYEERLHARDGLNAKRDELQAALSSGDAGFRSIKDYETQLSALAKGIEKADFDLEHLGAELERYEAAEAKATALRADLDAQAAELTKALQAELRAMRERVQQLRAERERVVGASDEGLVARYERARARFGTIAVETLSGNVPSGCRVALRPSDYQALRRSGQAIAECPYCKRLLVLEEGE